MAQDNKNKKGEVSPRGAITATAGEEAQRVTASTASTKASL